MAGLLAREAGGLAQPAQLGAQEDTQSCGTGPRPLVDLRHFASLFTWASGHSVTTSGRRDKVPTLRPHSSLLYGARPCGCTLQLHVHLGLAGGVLVTHDGLVHIGLKAHKL
ncbi:hypothetical protein GCM10010156_63900 [Planobispora rosea]|uniref:Uncharacterized protein n=1 Tax=Planobispora rosea TaxID=35762 RepID=A0A8J3WFS3_PLARO|nr:hypothetical protein GCM10010156_63900 [Planobispora rosea]GIH87740.1 hypothetical protein Pro02_61480 [Planobispora rosea]